jgi:hypothetical protein
VLIRRTSLEGWRAEVAELADARGSGPRTRKGVGVRVPSSAPTNSSHQSTFLNVIFLVPAATSRMAANLSVNELILRVVWGSFKEEWNYFAIAVGTH